MRVLEAVGVDYLWSGEAYMADAVSALGFLAAITERAQIGSSILPIYSRTPTLIAMTAVGLDKLSGGRFVLGLGASGPQVIEGFHGVPVRPAARAGPARSSTSAARCGAANASCTTATAITSRCPADQGIGLGKAMKLMDRPLRERIPIHVAALGAKNVAMTAELCEGWLPLHFWPDRADQIWGTALAEGLARRPSEHAAARHRRRRTARRSATTSSTCARQARPMLAMYFGGMGAKGKNFYNDVLRGYGFEQVAEEIQDAYLGGDRKAAEAMVPQELIDGMSLVGDEGFVRDRLAAYEAAGVTVLNVQPVGPNGTADIATLADWL